LKDVARAIARVRVLSASTATIRRLRCQRAGKIIGDLGIMAE